MKKSYKVMLIPNNKQRTKLFLYAKAARFAYNWVIDRQEENHNLGNPFIKEKILRREFTKFKRTDEFPEELLHSSNDAMKQAIRDAFKSYKLFFDKINRYPRRKDSRRSKPSFYQDTCKIKFTDTHVYIENIAESHKPNRQVLNWVKLAERGRIPINEKYYNPRITFDGLNWWVSVSIFSKDEPKEKCENSLCGLGIDFGLKNLAICSDGTVFENINRTSKVKKLERHRVHFQRAYSRKLSKREPGCFSGMKNLHKSRKRFVRSSRKITNIRLNYIRQVAKKIVQKNPSFICIEDLNVIGMIKNKRFSKSLMNQSFGMFRKIISEKCEEYNIHLVVADRFFPSSKMCMVCGTINGNLTLNDREYHCEVCGNTIDRDLQAAKNLEAYGKNSLCIA